MGFYFRWVGFLSALAPYDGSYWRDIMMNDEAPPAAESPKREEVTAARKVFPVVSRPQGMANTPAGEREPSRKPGTRTKNHARAESPAKKGTGAVLAPVASAKTPKGETAPVPLEKKPALTVENAPPVAAEVKAPVTTALALEPKLPEAPPRRCRVHQRRANPPPLRACLLCRLAAAKA